MRGDYKTSNIMIWAIFGFVFCLFWPLATYVCSGVALYMARKKSGERVDRIRAMSILSIVVSTIFLFISILFL